MNCSVNKQTDRLIFYQSLWSAAVLCDEQLHLLHHLCHAISIRESLPVTQAAEDLGHIINVLQDPVNLPAKHTVSIIKTPPDRKKLSGNWTWNRCVKVAVPSQTDSGPFLLRSQMNQSDSGRERETKHSSSAHHQKRAASDHTHIHFIWITNARWQTAGQIY